MIEIKTRIQIRKRIFITASKLIFEKKKTK